MSGRRGWTVAAWGAAGLASVLTAGAVVFRVVVGADALFMVLEVGASLPIAATVGAIIVARRSRNVVGWLLLAIGLGFAIQEFGAAYALHGLVRDTPSDGVLLSGADLWAAWAGAYGWVLPFPVMVFLLPLLYPDGRVPSRRWLPVLWFAVVLSLFGCLQALAATQLEVDGIPVGANPAAFPAAAVLIATVEHVMGVAFFPLVTACVVAVIVRFRRSRGVERQQIKWLVLPLSLSLVVLPLSAIPAVEMLARGLGGLVFASVPVAIGVAVLRYRLYEIDRVVNRTVVYGVVVGLLALTYAGVVVTLQGLLRPVAVGSDLAVAGSTLAVAALFGPVRRWVQSAVDLRFNRTRYDASRTVEGFAQRLRDEVEVAALSTELRAIVAATVQPTAVAVWIRPGGAR